ncbi:retrotransposon protein, putative, ty3-gypsy subclass [Tanacetum coccineum]
MDFVTKLPKSSSGHDTIWVVVDRLTKSAHFLPIRKDYKTEKLAKISTNKIVARHGMPVSIILDRDGRFTSHLWQAFQKALGTRLDMSTAYHPQTVVKVAKESLAPRYVGPFEIVEHVGPVAYRLKLPQELSCVHDTFHVSNLKKCLAEPDVQVPLDEIEIDENLRFVEEPIEIVERDVKKLKRRRIPLVKVRWNSRQGAEYTWEHEDQFRKKYPNLFSEPVPSSSAAT